MKTTTPVNDHDQREREACASAQRRANAEQMNFDVLVDDHDNYRVQPTGWHEGFDPKVWRVLTTKSPDESNG